MPPKKGTKKQTKKPEESKIDEVTNTTESDPTAPSEEIVDPKPIATSPQIKTSSNISSKSSAIITIDKNIILNANSNNGNHNIVNIGSVNKNNEHKDDELSNENEQKQHNVLKTKLEAVVNFKQSNTFKNEAQLKMLELRQLRFESRATSQVNTLTAEEVNRKFLLFNKVIQISEAEKRKLQERAKKFGLKTAEEEVSKLKKRAERFHLTSKVYFLF